MPVYDDTHVIWYPGHWNEKAQGSHNQCQKFWFTLFEYLIPKHRAHLIQTDIWFRRSSFDDLDAFDEYHRRDTDLNFRSWLEGYTKRMKGSKQENFFKIRIPLEAKEDTIPEDYILKERDSYHSFGEAATTRPDQEERHIVRSASQAGRTFSAYFSNIKRNRSESGVDLSRVLLGTAEVKPKPPFKDQGTDKWKWYLTGCLAQVLKYMSVGWDVYGARHALLTIGTSFRRLVLVDRKDGTGVDLLVDLGPRDPTTGELIREDQEVSMTLSQLFHELDLEKNFYEFAPLLDSEEERGNPREVFRSFFLSMGQHHLDRARLQREPEVHLSGRIARIEHFDLGLLTDCLSDLYWTMLEEEERLGVRPVGGWLADRLPGEAGHFGTPSLNTLKYDFDADSLSDFEISDDALPPDANTSDTNQDVDEQGILFTDENDDFMRRYIQATVDKRYELDRQFGLYRHLERRLKGHRETFKWPTNL
jgi:hypothetical protein